MNHSGMIENIRMNGGMMMDLNLRNAVIGNVTGQSKEELQNVIVDAIERGEEKMLPGLGVLFEVIWQHANENEKGDMLGSLESGLKTT
jgi:small acid-soluble spore protein I (minor)